MVLKIVTPAVIFNSPDDIEVFPVEISEDNYLLARGKMEYEREKMIEYLKDLKDQGLISSIFRPKNKRLQKQLDQITKSKRTLAESIDKIRLIYRNI